MTPFKMPDERKSVTHRFQVGDMSEDGVKGYITVGLLEDGRPGEVFLRVNKQGTLERGLFHTIALLISMLLQQGHPIEQVVDKLKGITFEPQEGIKKDGEPRAKSVVDYLGLWLERKFIIESLGKHDPSPLTAPDP